MKKQYFCNPVLRVTRTARVREDAPLRGAGRGEGRTGNCSLNEWNDVANTQEILLRDSSEKTRPGQTKQRKKLIRMESLILAQDERWRQA